MAIETTFSVRKDDRVSVLGSETLGSVMIRAASTLKNNESVTHVLWLPAEVAKALIADLQSAVADIEAVAEAKARRAAEREAA